MVVFCMRSDSEIRMVPFGHQIYESMKESDEKPDLHSETVLNIPSMMYLTQSHKSRGKKRVSI